MAPSRFDEYHWEDGSQRQLFRIKDKSWSVRRETSSFSSDATGFIGTRSVGNMIIEWNRGFHAVDSWFYKDTFPSIYNIYLSWLVSLCIYFPSLHHPSGQVIRSHHGKSIPKWHIDSAPSSFRHCSSSPSWVGSIRILQNVQLGRRRDVWFASYRSFHSRGWQRCNPTIDEFKYGWIQHALDSHQSHCRNFLEL